MTTPQLPEPAAEKCIWKGPFLDDGWVQWHDADDPKPLKWDDPPSIIEPYYTAAQMQEHGAAQYAEGRADAYAECIKRGLIASECRLYADDYPGARAQCASLLKAGERCTDCPQWGKP